MLLIKNSEVLKRIWAKNHIFRKPTRECCCSVCLIESQLVLLQLVGVAELTELRLYTRMHMGPIMAKNQTDLVHSRLFFFLQTTKDHITSVQSSTHSHINKTNGTFIPTLALHKNMQPSPSFEWSRSGSTSRVSVCSHTNKLTITCSTSPS